MGNYVIGGWTQNVTQVPPSQFSYTMYGMITNLQGLTSGTPANPGWSPKTTSPPSISGKALWTYGGAGSTPPGMPATQADVDAIVDATASWDGVSFDDEAGENALPNMNIGNSNEPGVISAMRALKKNSKDTSYSFAAGYDYVQPGSLASQNVQKLVQSGVCDRFVLLCYAGAMWPYDTINVYVPAAVNQTLRSVSDSSQVILALTTAGLDQKSLEFFLDQVTSFDLGGLFIWDFPALSSDDLKTIIAALGSS